MSSEKLLLRQDFTFEPRSGDEVQSGNSRWPASNANWRFANPPRSTTTGSASTCCWSTRRPARPGRRRANWAYYWGYDDGRWTEGSRDDEVVFVNIPPAPIT